MEVVAVVATHINSTIQSDAFDLLDGVEGGLGDVLYQIAESFARARSQQGDEVEITAADVSDAATALINALEKSDLPSDVRAWLKTMHEALVTKAHRRGKG